MVLVSMWATLQKTLLNILFEGIFYEIRENTKINIHFKIVEVSLYLNREYISICMYITFSTFSTISAFSKLVHFVHLVHLHYMYLNDYSLNSTLVSFVYVPLTLKKTFQLLKSFNKKLLVNKVFNEVFFFIL